MSGLNSLNGIFYSLHTAVLSSDRIWALWRHEVLCGTGMKRRIYGEEPEPMPTNTQTYSILPGRHCRRMWPYYTPSPGPTSCSPDRL